MADHSKPVLTSTYANFVTELDARFDDLAVGLDPAFSTPTNLPNNSVRWSSASNKWEKWNLTVWSPLSAGYDIDIANGSIVNSPISGSTGSFTTLAASGAFSLTGDQVQVSEGGTGATTAATARANLGAAPTASPVFTGPVSVSDGVGEGQILVGANDGYFFANSGEAGWYSPTLGSFKYTFATDQLSINGQTAWHQGNDGAGSGLDADLLDGQQGNYYAPTANPTFAGMTKAQQITVTDMTLKINPAATSAGYGVIHRNDGANYYLLLTNLNDALGGYNALRPMSMNCATGAINFDIVSAPTQAPGNDSTLLATTAFTKAAVDAVAPVAPGSAPKYACRAWVNFNGTGTPAIRASGNVSSITDNGTANYTVNFTTAMPDANFVTLASSPHGLTGNSASFTWVSASGTQTTSSTGVYAAYPSGDVGYVSVVVFR